VQGRSDQAVELLLRTQWKAMGLEGGVHAARERYPGVNQHPIEVEENRVDRVDAAGG
jgi:hypothetical protein